ncbi:MAG: signal peptidase I [Candidatus Aenigmatarchaeota archaeon]
MDLKETNKSILYVILGVVLAVGINQGLALGLSTDIPVVAVESNSMIPTFQRGDILVLHGVTPEELIIGDIIVFSPDTQEIPVVHRIVEVNDDGTFQTQGDANSRQLPFETRIRPDQIHGKVMVIVPYMGWVKISLTEYALPNTHWILLIVVLIAGMYLLVYKRNK